MTDRPASTEAELLECLDEVVLKLAFWRFDDYAKTKSQLLAWRDAAMQAAQHFHQYDETSGYKCVQCGLTVKELHEQTRDLAGVSDGEVGDAVHKVS